VLPGYLPVSAGAVPQLRGGEAPSELPCVGYARFRKESGFTPAEQEVVFLTISRENGCHYCVAAHSTLADAVSAVPTAVTDAIRRGTPIPDPRLRALSEFTRLLLAKRGRPDRDDVAPFLAAGYTERQILEVVLAISVKTLSNWANHLFATPVDAMFAHRAWSPGAEKAGAA
jgi:AhpD family alkylhydroperoxidase